MNEEEKAERLFLSTADRIFQEQYSNPEFRDSLIQDTLQRAISQHEVILRELGTQVTRLQKRLHNLEEKHRAHIKRKNI